MTGLVVVLLACFRFAHIHLLWHDEDYHLAAAMHMLKGKLPYRDFWYDKPPLNALFYVLIGAHTGWPLRLLDAAYIVLACYVAYHLGRMWWGEAEGLAAAFLLAFFLTFYAVVAVIPIAADFLMIAPHLASIYYARGNRAFHAGLWAGIAFLINLKAVFVLATCAVWLLPELPLLGLGFALPISGGVLYLSITKSLGASVDQIWRWGLIYASETVADPVRYGLRRTSNWLTFHAAATAGAIFAFTRMARDDRRKLAVWIALSLAAVCLGGRFGPHYYLQLLPPLIIAASRGIVLALRSYRRSATAILVLLLLVPAIRFGPRYAILAFDALSHRSASWPDWQPAELDLDSRLAAAKVRALARPEDTLFVWGYRPNLYVYTQLSPPGLYWDSQALTGVAADQSYTAVRGLYRERAMADIAEITRTSPTYVVDGLGPFNPAFSLASYPELASWLARYTIVDHTTTCLIYRRQRDR
jgi:hypothetical protein